MAKRKKVGVCAYCGEVRQLTVDHIPPKNLFPEPRPPDLITVPCCEPCRDGWSDDDEYFRAVVVSSRTVETDEGAQKVNDVFLRSLQKPMKVGFAQAIRDSMEEVEIQTKAGIVLGTAPIMRVEINRIERVAGRIVRGLYFREFGHRFPLGYKVTMRPMQFGLKKLQERLPMVSLVPKRSVGGGMFAYTFHSTKEDPNTSLWVLWFFGGFPFAGLIAADRGAEPPHEDPEASDSESVRLA